MTIARRRARLATAALGLAALVGLAAWKSRGEPPPPAAPAASAAALEIEPGTIASYTASLSVPGLVLLYFVARARRAPVAAGSAA